MTQVVVLGGTGYAGSHIVAEAVKRGFSVTSWSRNLPEEKIDGVTYKTGDLLDSSILEGAVSGANVVVGALSPRGALDGKLREVYAAVAAAAQAAGVRFGVVGGAGSLRVSEGGPTVASGADFPDAFKSEAAQLAEVLEDLRASDEKLDWFYVSPAGTFGAYAPGEATGSYRVGGEVLLTDENGESFISGADFAQAFVDEIVTPAHKRVRFSVAH